MNWPTTAARRTAAAIVVAGFALASCGGPELPDALRAPVTERVSALAAVASVALDNEQATCVADDLPLDLAERLAGQSARDAVDQEDAVVVSDAIVGCVGADVIGRAALINQAGGLRTTTLDCAAGELERPFLARLVASQMSELATLSAEIELQVAVAFSRCMTTDELLDR